MQIERRPERDCRRRIRGQYNFILQVSPFQSHTLRVLHARLLGSQVALKLPILHTKLLVRVRAHFHNAYGLPSQSQMLFYLFEISTSVCRIFRPISDVFGEVAWPSCWRLRIVICGGRARGYEEDDGCWEVEEFGVESHGAGFGVMTDEAEEPGDQRSPESSIKTTLLSTAKYGRR
jgi:hypothetical protein